MLGEYLADVVAEWDMTDKKVAHLIWMLKTFRLPYSIFKACHQVGWFSVCTASFVNFGRRLPET